MLVPKLMALHHTNSNPRGLLWTRSCTRSDLRPHVPKSPSLAWSRTPWQALHTGNAPISVLCTHPSSLTAIKALKKLPSQCSFPRPPHLKLHSSLGVYPSTHPAKDFCQSGLVQRPRVWHIAAIQIFIELMSTSKPLNENTESWLFIKSNKYIQSLLPGQMYSKHFPDAAVKIAFKMLLSSIKKNLVLLTAVTGKNKCFLSSLLIRLLRKITSMTWLLTSDREQVRNTNSQEVPPEPDRSPGNSYAHICVGLFVCFY